MSPFSLINTKVCADFLMIHVSFAFRTIYMKLVSNFQEWVDFFPITLNFNHECISGGIVWVVDLLLTLAFSLGCSCRKENALAGFMFRYLDQIFLINPSPSPHYGNPAVTFIFFYFFYYYFFFILYNLKFDLFWSGNNQRATQPWSHTIKVGVQYVCITYCMFGNANVRSKGQISSVSSHPSK